jgi:hypothetical protein
MRFRERTRRIFEYVSCKSRVPQQQDCPFGQIKFAGVLPQGREKSMFCAGCCPNLTKEMPMKLNRVGSVCAALIGLAVIATGVHSQEKKESAAAAPVKIMHFGDLKWTPIIKGCDLAAVAGDPNAEGTPYVVRLRCVDGAKIPAHWHPTDENVTVLKGTFLAGMGETFDEAKLTTMNVGNFVTMPKEMRHFAMSKGETIVQVHGAGPFKVNWVNPSEVQPPDAPAAAAAKPKS